MLGCGVTSAIHRVASTSLASTFLEEALDGRHDPGPLAVERSRCRSEYVSLFVCGMQTPLPRRGLATAVDEKAAPEALLPGRGRQFAGSDLCPLDALGCERMRAQKCEHRNFAALQLLQRREKPHHAIWIVPGCCCQALAVAVGFVFLFPTPASVQKFRSDKSGRVQKSFVFGRRSQYELQEQCNSQAAPQRIHAVFALDVRDFVADDVGYHIGVVPDDVQQGGGEENVATWCGKRIDGLTVQYG